METGGGGGEGGEGVRGQSFWKAVTGFLQAVQSRKEAVALCPHDFYPTVHKVRLLTITLDFVLELKGHGQFVPPGLEDEIRAEKKFVLTTKHPDHPHTGFADELHEEAKHALMSRYPRVSLELARLAPLTGNIDGLVPQPGGGFQVVHLLTLSEEMREKVQDLARFRGNLGEVEAGSVEDLGEAGVDSSLYVQAEVPDAMIRTLVRLQLRVEEVQSYLSTFYAFPPIVPSLGLVWRENCPGCDWHSRLVRCACWHHCSREMIQDGSFEFTIPAFRTETIPSVTRQKLSYTKGTTRPEVRGRKIQRVSQHGQEDPPSVPETESPADRLQGGVESTDWMYERLARAVLHLCGWLGVHLSVEVLASAFTCPAAGEERTIVLQFLTRNLEMIAGHIDQQLATWYPLGEVEVPKASDAIEELKGASRELARQLLNYVLLLQQCGDYDKVPSFTQPSFLPRPQAAERADPCPRLRSETRQVTENRKEPICSAGCVRQFPSKAEESSGEVFSRVLKSGEVQRRQKGPGYTTHEIIQPTVDVRLKDKRDRSVKGLLYQQACLSAIDNLLALFSERRGFGHQADAREAEWLPASTQGPGCIPNRYTFHSIHDVYPGVETPSHIPTLKKLALQDFCVTTSLHMLREVVDEETSDRIKHGIRLDQITGEYVRFARPVDDKLLYVAAMVGKLKDRVKQSWINEHTRPEFLYRKIRATARELVSGTVRTKREQHDAPLGHQQTDPDPELLTRADDQAFSSPPTPSVQKRSLSLSKDEEQNVRLELLEVLTLWFVKKGSEDHADDLLQEKYSSQIRAKLTEVLDMAGREVASIRDDACAGVGFTAGHPDPQSSSPDTAGRAGEWGVTGPDHARCLSAGWKKFSSRVYYR
ncbi:hypothetical protein ACOMHN_047147 [Nucella lapillus]